MPTNVLTKNAIDALKAGVKRQKVFDGEGMYLEVAPSGGKWWRFKYRFGGKEKLISLGVYPETSLKDAREKRQAARNLLAKKVDPSAARKAESSGASANSFEAIAREFHAQKLEEWSDAHSARWLERLKKDVFPYLGAMDLADITAPLLLQTLRRVEARGVRETVHSIQQAAGQVFRYGIATGRAERNPAADLRGALKPVLVQHMAAVTEPAAVGDLMRAIYAYQGQPLTRAALALSALLFQRPGNIRAMQWSALELTGKAPTWRIPATEMKLSRYQKSNGRPHVVPLPKQAVAFLEELRPLSGHGVYVFPSLLGGARPMSENTVNTALRRLGFDKETMTAHGFRAMARTLMSERLGIDEGVIEAQLAHGKTGPLGAAYDRAEFLAQRRGAMQKWADYLDQRRLAKPPR
ncbi:MAG: integrase arm-type DNA-binding domain-containing protein [Rhizobacter sp.]